MKKLRFIGIDPNTGDDECPTVWYDEEAKEIVIQGWKADNELRTACLETGSIPDSEDVVRLPERMVPILRKACDAAEGTDVR
ncbi:hypothetical protein [Kitasatospora purpeofusca]|uniref:hypothetical protein n=1 Tax=Kitasatospora purpeofusca TaxID=67352 RepID=UPI002A5ADB23|nr:hypothetical protein [Kitasatospora purpeofusca]MDY0816095.1 hypothetical protein [Kitasatospora purpeofusca]